MELETYRKKVWCGNCEEELWLEIPKGTLVEDFMLQVKCPNCGCPLLIPDIVKEFNTQHSYTITYPDQGSWTPWT